MMARTTWAYLEAFRPGISAAWDMTGRTALGVFFRSSLLEPTVVFRDRRGPGVMLWNDEVSLWTKSWMRPPHMIGDRFIERGSLQWFKESWNSLLKFDRENGTKRLPARGR